MPTCTYHTLPYRADPTPYFARIHQAHGAVLLDSGRPAGERGRYDLMSAWPLTEFVPTAGEAANDFLQRLRQGLGQLGIPESGDVPDSPFLGGLMGHLAYDFGRRLETVPDQAIDDLGMDDAYFGLYAWALVSDHQRARTYLVFHPTLSKGERQRLVDLFRTADREPPGAFRLLEGFKADLSADGYRQAIQRIQSYIQAGDCYQVNFAQRFSAPFTGDPWRAYLALRHACPTPFSGYLRLGQDSALLSVSPERFLQIRAGRVETRPIKGTRPRGATPREDAEQAEALQASPKDRAENLMIVDLLRNDLGRNCRIGSVRVPTLFALESYPNVHHLVSAVTGELASGRDALDLIAGSFPGGSITGAPKIRAMQIIEELENTRRGPYCGSLLYLDVRGEMDSSITIRTLLAKDGKVTCWGGGGIVADSAWQAEHQESIDKVSVLMRTLEGL